MTPPVPEEFAAFVDLDWADATHDVCIQAAGSARREFLGLEPRPDAIDAWVCTLRPRLTGQPVAVGLERNQGPSVAILRQYDVLVLWPVHPLPRAQSREAFTPRRAKDAPTDAELHVERLLTPRDTLTPLTPHSPTMRAVAQLVAPRCRLVGDNVRCTISSTWAGSATSVGMTNVGAPSTSVKRAVSCSSLTVRAAKANRAPSLA
jgi:hypothetical protein